MADSRHEALARLVAGVDGAARWLAALATRGAVVGGGAGLLLWWLASGDRLTAWWQGTAASLIVLAICLAPAAWLLNVRTALRDLVELPETLGGVATRRTGQLPRGAPARRPEGGFLPAVRSIWGVVRDYGDVVGSWGTVAQLLAPPFWLLTAVAFLALPVLVVLAGAWALVDL